jgi:hypothetical protein
MYSGAESWLRDSSSYVEDHRNYIQQGLISGNDAQGIIDVLDGPDGSGEDRFDHLDRLVEEAHDCHADEGELPEYIVREAEKMLDVIIAAHEDIELLTTEMQTYVETHAISQSQSEGSVREGHQKEYEEAKREATKGALSRLRGLLSGPKNSNSETLGEIAERNTGESHGKVSNVVDRLRRAIKR